MLSDKSSAVDSFESVRVAPELLERIEAQDGIGPVHIIGVERHDDGTLELWLQTPKPDERLREALDAITRQPHTPIGARAMAQIASDALSEKEA